MVSEWPSLSLREAGVSLIDCDHRTPPSVEFGYPYVTIPQLRGGHIDLADARRISHEHFLEWTQKAKPSAYDVVLSRRCNPGETAFVAPGLEFALGQNLVLLRADGRKVIPPFLRWLVRGPEWWDQIAKFLNVGAVFDSLRCADIPNFELPIPPLQEQRAIADILGALDNKIEVNRRINATLEAILGAVFNSWFVDYLPVLAKTETGEHSMPSAITDLFPDSFQESELGNIPKGWGVKSLGELCSVAIGGDWGREARFDGAVEVICLRGVDLEHLRFSGCADAPRRWIKASSLEQRHLDECDVLIAGSGAGPSGRPLWFAKELNRVFDLPITYSNFCKRLRCDSATIALFLDRWLHLMRQSGEIWEYVNGTSVPNLDTAALLKGKSIVIPPEPILLRFASFVRPIYARLYLGESAALALMRDSLLPKLLSGELRIRDAERIIGRAM